MKTRWLRLIYSMKAPVQSRKGVEASRWHLCFACAATARFACARARRAHKRAAAAA